jgi:hypothetical protein
MTTLILPYVLSLVLINAPVSRSVDEHNGQTYANTEMMNLFIKQVAGDFSQYFVIMLVDKAGWHRSNDLNLPSNVRLRNLRLIVVSTVAKNFKQILSNIGNLRFLDPV